MTSNSEGVGELAGLVQHKLAPVKHGQQWAPFSLETDKCIGVSSAVPLLAEKYHEWWAAILIPHETFRMEGCLILDLLSKEHIKGDQPWKVDNFAKYFRDFYYPAIGDHHDNEEEIYMPYINNLPNCTVGDKVAADHHEIVDQLDVIIRLLDTWGAADGEGSVDRSDPSAVEAFVFERLRPAIVKYHITLLDHLKEEEELYPTMVRDHSTKAAEDAIVAQIIRKGGLGAPGNALELPWFLDCMKRWGGQDYHDAFRSTLPGPIRLLHDNFWAPKFNSYWRPLLYSLLLDENPNISLKSPSTYSCSIL